MNMKNLQITHKNCLVQTNVGVVSVTQTVPLQGFFFIVKHPF